MKDTTHGGATGLRVVLFGATGMVGGGALLECLEDQGVSAVLVVGRRPCGVTGGKLRELILPDLFDLERHEADLRGYDACLYCLGVSAAGMSEADYRRVTLDLTLAVAGVLGRASPGARFCFVSGQGTDSSERGRFMWARVKGEAENRLLEGPLDAWVFRPGFIQPEKGVRSATAAYQALYTVLRPLFPLLERLFPEQVTTTSRVGRALVRVARDGYGKRILETRDINAAARTR